MTTRSIAFAIALLTALLVLTPVAPSAVPTVYAADPPVLPLDAAPFGINTHLATRYTDIKTLDVPASIVAASGAGWAREDIHWFRVEPQPGVWDWAFTDAAFRSLLSRNIKIVGVLGHPPGWATPYPGDGDSDISFYAPDQQRYVEYARAVVQRYGAYVDHWEIWNEPDNPLFWKPAPDPLAYSRLLIATSAAIHEIDPEAKVLLGGINPFNLAYLRQVADAGAWNSFDILAIHPYVDPLSPEDGGLLSAADGVRAIMGRIGQKPLWATEVGWSSGAGDHDPVGVIDEQMQANYLTRSMLLLWRAGIERSFWYALKDDINNPYGLVALGNGRDDFSRLKPAYAAFRTLSQQMAGASFVSLRDLFTQDTVLDFETFGRWTRGDQPYGSIVPTRATLHDGYTAAAIHYSFPSEGNDFLVFTRSQPLAIPGTPHELGVWVYGDGTANVLKVWLRDAEGELLQYSFGTVGPLGWHQLHVSLAAPVATWDRISQGGNGKLDFPASVASIVLDDGPDSFSGRGTVYVDSLSAIGGPEAYNLRARRGTTQIDVLWSPDAIAVTVPAVAAGSQIAERDGRSSTLAANGQSFGPIQLSDAPRFVAQTVP